ncbi:N-acetyl-gamma-glutamyl-phosphate reductase [Corynebacterium sp. TAE3-ERU12]|uniref:N-acetyl-gamma-glutamyl-phosphate reductase n=1 Tax=Corynebacterium sp. TAE3-ERU12 TaxID=2849491 RepID=UPI001C46E4BC|nr:N-acetyl-gamma-glutamyl-phosphate reductase [Corynebacterium sp. TAE3-ERU12]MBV7296122.1 N-acetyl-gamma-glutamyl-phosphate reductase [Corynebacterium sp. TAE3-ERU12]
MTISVAVAGASGYAGGEVLRLLLAHPAYQRGELTIGALTGASNAGQRVGDIMPHLAPLADRVIEDTTAEVLAGHDAVFLGLPHGHSAAIAQQLADAGSSPAILDCGADFRLQDAGEWEHYYGSTHAGTWTYGIPELPDNRERIRTSRTIAVPGCFPTGGTIAALPALIDGLVEPQLSIVSITGTSGAGKKPAVGLLGSEVMGNLRAYNTSGKHRHTAEFLQNLTPYAADLSVSFTPVLAPTSRGILTVLTAPLAQGTTAESAHAAYTTFYADEPFVQVLAPGNQPQTQSVVGSNMVQLQVEVDERAGRLLVTGAIDNLTKGTAGAAVQCMNLILGLPETDGLPMAGVAP